MKGFGFTKKKFLSLSEKGRHTHLMAWLSSVYQTLSTNRASRASMADFTAQYKMISDWMTLPCPPAPDPCAPVREWLVYVSDAIHIHRTASGLVARDHNLLERVSVEDREKACPDRPDMDYQVALDGLRSLFNVGSVFRTCEAAGVSTIILGNCPGREDPRVRKTAMGADLTQEKTDNLGLTLLDKKKEGFRIICLETMAGARPCHEYHWPQKAVIVAGNEEYGISPHVLTAMDDAVAIPMFGKKNSLNVANALSTVLFQAVFSRMAQAPVNY